MIAGDNVVDDRCADKKKKPHIIDKDACIACGSCREACRFGAVRAVKREGGRGI